MKLRSFLVLVSTLVIALAGAGGALAGPPPPPSFATTAVSLPGDGPGARMVAFSVLRFPGFDRIVLAFRGGRPRISVAYVPRIEIVRDPPVPGAPPRFLSIAGRALLRITTFESGVAPAIERRLLLGQSFGTSVVRQLKLAPGFGGVVPLGAGLRRKVPFRVLTLANPARYAIDFRLTSP